MWIGTAGCVPDFQGNVSLISQLPQFGDIRTDGMLPCAAGYVARRGPVRHVEMAYAPRERLKKLRYAAAAGTHGNRVQA